ncbi:MAG TPA: outer membrane lipoprotein carrier protein LolA [Alphaproteobacteria bacterium]|nr:outer membrane lipoprotein carrier protein LolA [Alphaproteobacteria bacterium]
MCSRSIRAILTIAALALAAPSAMPVPPVDVGALARAVDDHHNRLKSLKADFTEIYQGPGVSRTESGVLWLKKPGKMRWEYHQPKEKLFLSDSKAAYFYVPSERQVRRMAIKDLDDVRSPLRFLLGKTKLEKELELLSLAPDVTPLESGDTVLRGIPKYMKDRIADVLLEITPGHQIRRIVLQGVDGTLTDFHFTHIEDDARMSDTLFRFTPPAGVEVISGAQPTQ